MGASRKLLTTPETVERAEEDGVQRQEEEQELCVCVCVCVFEREREIFQIYPWVGLSKDMKHVKKELGPKKIAFSCFPLPLHP